MTSRMRATVAGFVGAVLVLSLLLWAVGVDRVLGDLAKASLPVVALVLVVACTWQLMWGLALRTVLDILGEYMSVKDSFLVFMSATFANGITPFGQAGGEPITALLISRLTDAEYESSLASIASVDALNFVPSLGLGIIGIAYYAATVTLGRRLEIAGVVVTGVALVLGTGAVVGWRHRYELERLTVRVFTPVVRRIAGVVPRVTPPTPESLERRIEAFFHTLERITGDGERLALALAFSAAGWLGLMTCLWLSLFAVGQPIPFAAVLVAVPLGALASVTPLPGGLGGVEAILIAVLIPTTGLTIATISAGVFLHRLATYWFPMVVGGGAASHYGVAYWD